MDERSITEQTYEAPNVIVLGSIVELTQQNFTSANTDFNFNGIELIGTS